MAAVVVKASVHGQPLPRRVSFRDASELDRDSLAIKLARAFTLQPDSFRIAYRDDDNDLVELATSADILECLDYFATDPSVSSSSSLARLPSCITVRLELVVEYDGPNLSETDAASSVWSAAPSARPGGPATRATSFGGEREAVLTRWRMQQQEATIDVDAASDDWIRRPAFSVVAAAAAGSQPPVDSASSSASASAIDADNEQDWDTRTVSSISFAPVRALPTNPSLRRPTNVTEDALYPNFAPPPRWLSSLGPAAQPPYPLPFSFSPYSAPEIPVLSPTHARGNDCTLPPVAPHHYAPLFAPTQGSFDIHFARPSVREVADSLDGFSLASPSQSLRERVQDLFAPSSDDESVRGGGDPLFGRQVPVRIASEALHGRNAESTWTATDSDTDSLPPSGHDQNGTIRAKETAAETRARLKALADLRGEYWCTECGKRIEGARYSCAVCEGFDLCRDCELGPPSRSSSRRHKPETIPLRHDLSHILLKIPISLSLPALGSALLSAHTLASSLAQPRSHPAPLPSSLSHSTASYLEKGDLDSYWSWWMRWYAQMPPGSHALWPTGMGTEEVSKHSWSAQGATSVGGGGGRREEHTYPPQPPAPSAPPAPPTPPPPPSHISSASAVVRPSTFSRFSSPHFTHFAAASHGVSCRHCGEMIVASRGGPAAGGGVGDEGVRWLCGNCPTVPSFDLCPTCEPLSTRIHDPTHAFLCLTHPLRRSLPSISQGLLPLLCLPPSSEEHVKEDGEVVHRTVICDACGVRIKGAWMRCCHCPTSYDLCRPCLLSGASFAAGHNPSHVFAALKRNVDLALLKEVTRITSRRPRGLVEWDLYA